MEGGEHAGVGVPEVAEVVVRRVLAAEDGARAGHLGLDEGVADPGADGDAAVLADDLRHARRRDQVVDDRAAGVLGELAGGDEGGDGGRRDRFAALVDHEAAVGVAVEGEAEVGALGADAGLEVHDVGGVERVRLMVGERAVQLEVHRDEGEGSPSKTVGTVWPPMPLPASTTTFSGRMDLRSTSDLRWSA